MDAATYKRYQKALEREVGRSVSRREMDFGFKLYPYHASASDFAEYIALTLIALDDTQKGGPIGSGRRGKRGAYNKCWVRRMQLCRLVTAGKIKTGPGGLPEITSPIRWEEAAKVYNAEQGQSAPLSPRSLKEAYCRARMEFFTMWFTWNIKQQPMEVVEGYRDWWIANASRVEDGGILSMIEEAIQARQAKAGLG